MVGGIVTDVWIWAHGKVSVAVQGTGSERNEYLEQRLEKNDYSLGIKRGDSLWWQLGYVYWTPQDGSLPETKIKRFGLSIPVLDGLTRKRHEYGFD